MNIYANLFLPKLLSCVSGWTTPSLTLQLFLAGGGGGRDVQAHPTGMIKELPDLVTLSITAKVASEVRLVRKEIICRGYRK